MKNFKIVTHNLDSRGCTITLKDEVYIPYRTEIFDIDRLISKKDEYVEKLEKSLTKRNETLNVISRIGGLSPPKDELVVKYTFKSQLWVKLIEELKSSECTELKIFYFKYNAKLFPNTIRGYMWNEDDMNKTAYMSTDLCSDKQIDLIKDGSFPNLVCLGIDKNFPVPDSVERIIITRGFFRINTKCEVDISTCKDVNFDSVPNIVNVEYGAYNLLLRERVNLYDYSTIKSVKFHGVSSFSREVIEEIGLFSNLETIEVFYVDSVIKLFKGMILNSVTRLSVGRLSYNDEVSEETYELVRKILPNLNCIELTSGELNSIPEWITNLSIHVSNVEVPKIPEHIEHLHLHLVEPVFILEENKTFIIKNSTEYRTSATLCGEEKGLVPNYLYPTVNFPSNLTKSARK